MTRSKAAILRTSRQRDGLVIAPRRHAPNSQLIHARPDRPVADASATGPWSGLAAFTTSPAMLGTRPKATPELASRRRRPAPRPAA